MKSTSFLAIGLFSLVSCHSTGMNFNTMSDAQIMAYNQTVGQWEQVYCHEEASVRSRIPRRRCETLLEVHQRNVRNVDTINSVSTGNSLISID